MAYVFDEGELDEKVVIAKIATTTHHGAIEGKTQAKDVNFYNLDAIISVGYRVNSQRATHFRIWATKILNKYIRKGFVLDNEQLKRGYFDYVEDLIERENTFTMAEFEKSINEFLVFRRYDILEGKGSVSHKAAVKKAEDYL